MRRIGVLSVAVLLSSFFLVVPGCTGGGDTESEGDVVEAEQAITETCVLIQRDVAGDVRDTFLSGDYPTWAPGTSYNAYFGASSGGNENRALLDFDLSPVPASATITRATMSLNVAWSDVSSTASVRRVTQAWSENTVTQASFGAGGIDAASIATFPAGDGGWKSADITSLVSAWRAGTTPQYGVAVTEPAPNNHMFYTSESSAAYRPRLEVCYVAATCSDGVQNQGEAGVDCGGPCANACATCDDGVQNQGESGVDCGGPCAACPYSHTLTMDGVNEFTASETFATTTAGFTAYMSWDDTYFYVGMKNVDVASNSATKFIQIYLDGAPVGPATTTGVSYNTEQPGLAFPARYHVRWKTNNSFTNALKYNGSQWVDAGWNFAGDVFQSGQFIEMRIPRADLGSPSSLKVTLAMINEQPFAESTFSGVPSTTFTDGYDRDYSKYFQLDLQSAQAPASYSPLP